MSQTPAGAGRHHVAHAAEQPCSCSARAQTFPRRTACRQCSASMRFHQPAASTAVRGCIAVHTCDPCAEETSDAHTRSLISLSLLLDKRCRDCAFRTHPKNLPKLDVRVECLCTLDTERVKACGRQRRAVAACDTCTPVLIHAALSNPVPPVPSAVDTEEVKASEDLLERAATSGAQAPANFNAKAFRRSLNKTGRYTRQPTNDKASLALMDEHGVGYSLRGLVAQMKESGGVWKQVRAHVHATRRKRQSHVDVRVGPLDLCCVGTARPSRLGVHPHWRHR